MKNVILILAMHRSGTSALTRVVSLMGAALPKSILGKNDSNLRGHWESEKLIKSHDGLLARQESDWKDWRQLQLPPKDSLKSRSIIEDFQADLEAEYSDAEDVWLVKEPRICRFAPLYLAALKGAADNVHTVIMVRNPLEVAASLQSRDGLSKLDGLYLWLTHMLEAERASRHEPRSFVAYDQFLKSPLKSAQALESGISFELPYKAQDVKAQIESYVNPNFKRQSLEGEDVVLDPLARGWVSEAYEAFSVLCSNPRSAEALAKLDFLRASYFAALVPLYDVITHQRERHQQELDGEMVKANQLHERATEAFKAAQTKAWAIRDTEHGQAWRERDASHAEEIKLLKEKHQAQQDESAAKIQALMTEHAKAWSERDEEHENAWLERDQEYAAKIGALTDQHQALQHAASHEQEARDLSYAQEIAALTDKHDQQKLKWDEQHEKLKAFHEVAIDDLKSEHARTIEALKSEHARTIEALKSEHIRTTEQMRQELSFMRDEFGEILRASDMRADHNAAELDRLRQEMSNVLNSTSWKMTGGLRRLLNRLKGVKTHKPPANLSGPAEPPRLEFQSKD